jgi:hypothetical protein
MCHCLLLSFQELQTFNAGHSNFILTHICNVICKLLYKLLVHNEELHNFVLFPNYNYNYKAEEDEVGGTCDTNVHRLLVRKAEGKRPLGTPRRKWIDNIKMDLLVIGWDGVDWIGLALDRYRRRALVNAVMNLRVP